MEVTQTFAALPAQLAQAMTSKGYSELTAVQEAVLAPETEDRDLRIASQTGSGKTVAVGIVLARLLQSRPAPEQRTGPRALLIAPTRELATQLADELTWLFASFGLRIGVVTGGTNIGFDFRMLSRKPEVLIGTPGRLVDLLEREAYTLSQLEVVVLDEADEMLDMGFRDELEALLDQTPEDRRTIMVSATFAREVLRLANRYQKDALLVEGSRLGQANDDIEQVGMVVPPAHRFGALVNVLLSSPGERVLIFARTRVATASLASELLANGFAANSLSGDMSQRERSATLDAFREGKVQILVATDVAARGLDIRAVSKVVHFDIPENAEVFTHRSGRTGRAGDKGTSIVLVPPSGRRRIERMLRDAGMKMSWRTAPTAASIQKAADERLLAELSSDEMPEVTPRLRDLAARLLESRDPETLVANLLSRTDHAGPCAPRDLPSVSLDEPKSREGFKAREGFKKKGNFGGGGQVFRDFYVSWGARNGANPSRLLAMVCRRGDVRSNQIGAIHIGDNRSMVQVSSSVAEQFARAASRPDERNPRIKIRPWTGETDSGRAEQKPRRQQRAASRN